MVSAVRSTGSSLPHRPLGRTGREVSVFGLGGEGVLRTHGRASAAAAVIHAAIDAGVTYCDTAPAYSSSQDYYGATLGERRGEIFLASKTHDRTRDGSLRLLENSLSRLRASHLDLWQLHDLRTTRDLDQIFAPGGAVEALRQAREEGLVRHVGLTGHHDPEILKLAMQRFDFDTLLVALNAADTHRLSFAREVLPDAVQRGLGIIAMKVFGAGTLVGPGRLTPEEAMGYVLSLPGVTTAIIGCANPEEVAANARAARSFTPMLEVQARDLESRTRLHAPNFTSYKRPA